MVHSFFYAPLPAARRALGRLIGLLTLVLLLSFLGTQPVKAQNRPDIKWMHGIHFLTVQAVLSPDTTTLVTVGLDNTIKIRRTSDGILLRTIDNKGPYSQVSALAMSPDGTKIVVGSMTSLTDNSLSNRIYRISDGALLLSWAVSNHTDALAWSPDGTKIAESILGSNDIHLRSATDGSILTTLTGHTSSVGPLAFSPDGARLVSGSNDFTVRLWNTADGTLLHTFIGATNFIDSVAFSPDNHTLASTSDDGILRLWDANSGLLLHSIPHSASRLTDDLAFSPDGSVLATGVSQVQTWNVATGALLHSATLGPVPTAAIAVSYTPNGTYLMAVGQDPAVTFYNSADLSIARSLTLELNGLVGVTPDSAHVVSVGFDRTIWNTGTGALESLAPSFGRLGTMALSPDGTTIAATDDLNTLRVVRLSDGVLQVKVQIGFAPYAVAWSRDGKELFHCDSQGAITIRKASDGSKIGTLTGSPGEVRALAVSPDGKLLAGAGVGVGASNVYLWRLADSSLLSTFTGHTDVVNSLAFSPDSAKLLSGSADGTAILWNVADGTKLRILPNGSYVGNVAFAPDGQSFATAAFSPLAPLFPLSPIFWHLYFWRVSDGGLFGDFINETQNITSLTYTPDNANIVYTRLDATVVLAANPALNPFQANLVFNPATVVGGVPATATLTLAQPAPAGGVAFTLGGGISGVTLFPNSVTIAEGATSATFTVTTTPVLVNTRVPITATNSGYTVNATLNILAHLPADFTNSGHNALIFQSQTNNTVALWFTNVLNIIGGSTLRSVPQPGWKVVGAGDFNRDTNSDLVFQNQTTGQVVIWYMMGTTYIGGEALSFPPGAGYKVVGIGDFNGDGKPDILFQQQGTGQLVIWFMDGATVTGGVSIPQIPPASYKVVGVGDLEGDGNVDIVFQDQTNNQVVAWRMRGTQFQYINGVVYLPPTAWKVQAVIDINGDGKADIVFQNQTTNQMDVWYLNPLAPGNPTTVTGGGFLSLVPFSDYKLMGPH